MSEAPASAAIIILRPSLMTGCIMCPYSVNLGRSAFCRACPDDGPHGRGLGADLPETAPAWCPKYPDRATGAGA